MGAYKNGFIDMRQTNNVISVSGQTDAGVRLVVEREIALSVVKVAYVMRSLKTI